MNYPPEVLLFMNQWVKDWFIAFLITQAIESPIYYLALYGKGTKTKRALLSITPSALTHLWVWFVFPFWLGFTHYQTITLPIAESFALFIEALFLSIVGVKRALLWSFAANGLSFGLGLVWQNVSALCN